MTTCVCHHHRNCCHHSCQLLCHYHHHYHCHLSPPSPLSLPSVTNITTAICHHYCHHHHHHHTLYSCCTKLINVVSTCQQGSFSQHLVPPAAAHNTHNSLHCTYVIKQKFHPFVPVLFMYHNVTYHGVWCNGTSGTEQRHLRHTDSKHPATPKILCSSMPLFLTTVIGLSNFTPILLYNCIQWVSYCCFVTHKIHWKCTK